MDAALNYGRLIVYSEAIRCDGVCVCVCDCDLLRARPSLIGAAETSPAAVSLRQLLFFLFVCLKRSS